MASRRRIEHGGLALLGETDLPGVAELEPPGAGPSRAEMPEAGPPEAGAPETGAPEAGLSAGRSLEAAQGAEGSLDAISGRVVEGWAFDAGNPDRAVLVEIFDRDRRIGETPAGQFREDLLEAGIGDGSHAFRFLLPLELFDGDEHVIIACIAQTGRVLHNSPFTLRTEQLPIQQSFPSGRSIVSTTPPLSDVQFTMLRGINAIADALAVQSRALEGLIGHLTREHELLPPASAVPMVRALTEEEQFGPLLATAREHPRGRHDIIVFSIIDWNFRIQRPQHLAGQLAALGSRVFYLSITFVDAGAQGAPFVIRSQPAEGVFEVALTCHAPLPSIYAGIEDTAQIEDITASLLIALAKLRRAQPGRHRAVPGLVSGGDRSARDDAGA